MFELYEVGGKVRDELLGLENKDIDYVAVPNPNYLDADVFTLYNSLVEQLQVQGYTIFLETPACYTIRAKFPIGHKNAGITADFVLARKELGYKPGTREPIVVPGTLLDDLTRRDFTVNAIAKAMDGTIIDPFNGIADIAEGILKTPISGDITFDDDPLRLLRAVRFHVTKNLRFSGEIIEFIQFFDYDNKFSVVSEERIREELYKALKHDTLKTLRTLHYFHSLEQYIFTKTSLWLKPTNEQ